MIKNRVKSIFVLIILFILSQIPMTITTLVIQINQNKNLAFNIFEIAFVLSIILIVLYFFLLIAKKQDVIGGEHFPKPKDFTLIGVSFVAVIILNMIGNLLIGLNGGDTTANQATLNSLFDYMPMAVAVPLVAVCAPVMEEIVFRAAIIRKIFAGLPLVGCFFSVLIFGLLHSPTDIGSAVIYFGMGIVLTNAYYRTKNIYVSISLHALINFMGIIAIYMS
ncbi:MULTISPECIES: type II CAAX endopeptidase family protein [unclassified Enterococcus]|uniref:CPBP family intramembrane glutamic endopeptidase n=1 Tax=unclassified Enterococcus TaxID=2608891 RepID=UPI001553EA53|nr:MULTISPECIES: type II CAAX endopeptidase family protein [unclassified Enterococcus]MBS7576210.1 CPBP family intramembrane metalloprotease [Enterococcus sp. MMGLQ5-2]NPD11303.1 CPBP family intramembrane metalloprotease [Enterococcus sp. MMGLQ5-1]NPD36046.1 CPBP family intramembrane metalloprotease [Enterococcus sp. MMGLQ5-2]